MNGKDEGITQFTAILMPSMTYTLISLESESAIIIVNINSAPDISAFITFCFLVSVAVIFYTLQPYILM